MRESDTEQIEWENVKTINRWNMDQTQRMRNSQTVKQSFWKVQAYNLGQANKIEEQNSNEKWINVCFFLFSLANRIKFRVNFVHE